MTESADRPDGLTGAGYSARTAYDTSWFGDMPMAPPTREAPMVYSYDLDPGRESVLKEGALSPVWISPDEVLVTEARYPPPGSNILGSWELLGTVTKVSLNGTTTTTAITSTLDATALYEPLPAREASPVPSRFFAVASNALLAGSTETGETEVIYQDPAFALSDLSLSPDRQTVYFTRTRRGSGSRQESGEVVAMPVGGGALTRIAEGFAPAVSPDGRRLAYVHRVEEPGNSDACPVHSIGIGDLIAGDEATVDLAPLSGSSRNEGSCAGPPFHLAWAFDSQRLAYHRNIGPASFHQAWILDTAQTPAEVLLIGGSQTVLAGPIFAHDGSLYAISPATIGFNPETDRAEACEGWISNFDYGCAIFEADPVTGRVLGEVLDAGKPILSLSFDRSGEHLIYVVREGCPDRCAWSIYRQERSSLVLVSSGNAPRNDQGQTPDMVSHIAW